jgi:hypothetical protein
MNRKLRTMLAGVTAAAVLAGGMFATTTSASAKPWWPHQHRYYGGWGYNGGGYVGAGILGFITGAAIGSALSQNNYYGDDSYCYRYKTYNPQTGMYMSYNGPRHCP